MAQMKLWILRPLDPERAPWKLHGKVFGFVVRAETKERARALAAMQAGNERSIAWLSTHYSTCVELKTSHESEEVIIRDFRAG